MNLTNDKKIQILKYAFIAISLISILYATFTMRGLYNDGSYFMINILNNMANNNYMPVVDPTHPRQLILIVMQIPIWLCNILHLNNKNFLIYLFTFTQFFTPLLILYWNYKLSQKTNRHDIFFWHFVVYSLILIPCSIFSVTESIIGAGLSFILLNYLVSDIEFNKKDLFSIVLLLIFMFGTYEYTVYMGLIFFLFSIKFAKDTKITKNKIIKISIGIVSLLAALYNIFFMMNVSGDSYEVLRFLIESIDYIKKMFNMCILLSITAVILLFISCFGKKRMGNLILIGIFVIFLQVFSHLIANIHLALLPGHECQYRTIICWALPLIFLKIFAFNKKKIDDVKYYNFIIIVIMCGIFQNLWQMVNTYYWQKNITYVKIKLAKSKDLLFIPENHIFLSSFADPRLYRYVWYGTYPAMSILLSPQYEQKTLLLIYYNKQREFIRLQNQDLYRTGDQLSIPSFKSPNYIDIKNRYWDLSKCADALDEFNKNREKYIYGRGYEPEEKYDYVKNFLMKAKLFRKKVVRKS